MNNGSISRISKRKLMISLLLGIFTSIGMNLSLTAQATLDNSKEILMDNEKMVYVRTMALSMSGDRIKLLLFALVVAGMCYLYLVMREHQYCVKQPGSKEAYCVGGKKERIYIFLFSFLFAVLQMVAKIFKTVGSYVLYKEEYAAARTRIGIKGLAFFFFCYLLLSLVFPAIIKFCLQEEGESRKMTARGILISVVILLLCWLPYFIIFYPGTSNEDTVIQLMEYFKIPSYINTMTSVQGDDIFLTNHHPYVLTMIFGWFVDLGLKLGDIRKGVAIYTMLHMTCFATAMSIGIEYLKHIGVSRKRVISVLLFMAVFPLIPLYSICMVKDTIYGSFCLFLVLMMFEVARTRGEVLGSWKFNIALFINSILMMLTKVYGMYILLIIAVIYLWKYRKYFLRTLASIVVPVLLYKFLYISMLLPALNVAPGGIQEALSIPIQQTTRYVVEYPQEVTAEEKKAISKLLPYKKLEKLYNPELSDPVKKRFNQEATSADIKNYFKVWAKMFAKHPEVYVESFLANTYQYYDVNKVSNLQYYHFNTYLQDHPKKYDPQEYSWLYVINEEKYTGERYAVNQLILALQKTPIVNVFLSLGMLSWIVLGFWYLNIFRNRREYNIALLLPVITVAICLVSPDNGNTRYIIPIVLSIPFLICMLTLKEASQNQEDSFTQDNIEEKESKKYE